jgi:hypothetical protein
VAQVDWTTVTLIGLGVMGLVAVGYLSFLFFMLRSVSKMQDDFFEDRDDLFGRR